jgi:DnaJ-class molecular chaperone
MELYNVLGVEKGADERQIKKAYFDLAKKHHPDKGGDAEEFKKIQRAYDILSNSDKRSYYDQTGQVPGEEELNSGGPVPFPFDLGGLFGMFGGGMPFGMGGMGGMGGQPRGPPSSHRQGKAPPKVHEMNLKLDDFYHGRTIKMNFNKQKFCTSCKGDGFTGTSNCTGCQGSGKITRQQMMGPGMVMMSTSPCAECKGNGFKAGPKCTACQGKCFTNEQNNLDVVIEAGMKPGERLMFHKECSDTQEYSEAGDLHILLGEADEDIPWKRDGIQLKATLELNLMESLCGCTKTIYHHPGFPDGLEVIVPPGSCHQDQLFIKNGGMPIRGNLGNLKGEAVITLRVTITSHEKQACDENKELLRKIFTIKNA